MMQRSDRFVIHFAILFLTVLLAMFALFHIMDYYDGTSVEGGAVYNFTEAFHVNLFLIDLSLLLVFESLLILLFVRYTVPALVGSSALVLVLVALGRRVFDQSTIMVIVAPFARTEHAALGHRHVVLLFVLNALLLSFLVAMMHHYQQFDVREEAARRQAGPAAGDPTDEKAASGDPSA